MNPISKVMKMHFRDKWVWFMLPWVILSSSFIINLIISFSVEEPIYTGGISSIYVYLFVTGIIVPAQTLPFALGFSIRRTDYYLGTLGYTILVCIFNGLVLLVMSIIEENINAWGSEMHFFNLPYVSDGSVLAQFWVNFSLFMLSFLGGFLINSIYCRVGKNGMFLFFIGISALSTIGGYIITSVNGWSDVFDWISNQTAFELSLWFVPLYAAFALIAYGLIRRTTV
jgi:hypothetical protein